MVIFRSIINAFLIPKDSDALVQAQITAFAKQAPMLYAVLLANAVFISITNFGKAPQFLTIWVTGAICLAVSIRFVSWVRLRNHVFTTDEAKRQLRKTYILSIAFGVSFISWSLAVSSYGGVQEQDQAIFFIAITIITSVFSLVHLRPVAVFLATVGILPLTAKFLSSASGGESNGIQVIMVLNTMVVVISMLISLYRQNNHFATMVAQRLDLERTNQEMTRLNSENFRLANIDALTGLPNRRAFFTAIDRLLMNHGQEKGFAIGLIDLDGFKPVNDIYGHAVGDALLKEASRRMMALAGPETYVARLGGDEFGIILTDPGSAEKYCEALCGELKRTYRLDGSVAEISASCGLATCMGCTVTATEILEHADYALYQAKAHANGGVVVFAERHRESLLRTHVMRHNLHTADLEAELHLMYQPVWSEAKGSFVSVEALAIWNNPEMGEVPATQFIAEAERSPLINRISIMLLRRMLADMETWPGQVRVSFNLSARCLVSADTMLQFVSLIRASKIDARRIEFEVTETAFVADFDLALKALNMLRGLGARISMDEYGKGYSNLNYVEQLPLDRIKIHRGFVQAASDGTKALGIIKAIVSLCDNLAIECVAEGVETPEQARRMIASGCHLLQGYHYSRHLPAKAVAALFAPALAAEAS